MKFRLINENEILIIGEDGKEYGHIFSENKNMIQICGFDAACNLWGCAVYTDSIGKHKKDIQLKFNDVSIKLDPHIFYNQLNIEKDCIRCYNKICSCENKTGIPYNVKRLL